MKTKFFLFLVLTFFTTIGWTQTPFLAPDIIIDTKLDSDWSGILIKRLRRLMTNFGLEDPFQQDFIEPLIVSEAIIQEYLDPSSEKLLTDLGHVLGLDILNGKTQISIHGLSYSVKGFRTNLHSNFGDESGVIVNTALSASNLDISADKLRLTLLLPGKKSVPVINIDVKNPKVIAFGEKLMNLFARIQIKDSGELFKLLVEDANFLNMAKTLIADKNCLSLEFSGIEIPDFSLKIGNRVISVDKSRVERLIQDQKEGIKGLLIAQLTSMLSNGSMSNLIKTIGNVEFNKEHWFDTDDLQTGLRIDSFSNGNDAKHLQVSLFGEFCTNELFNSFAKDCVNHIKTLPPVGRIDQLTFQNSMQQMKNLIDNSQSSFVISISEDYVNKILLGTYDAGLWADMLKESGIKMGPGKIKFRLEEKGASTGTVYMDIMYTSSKIERLAIGAKEVRFPAVMKAGLKIKLDQKNNLIPVVVIGLKDVDLSDETLINGRSDLDMPSNLKDLRLRKKVLTTIRSELSKLAHTDVLEFPFEELRGLGLETVKFISDGQGRMNALMKVQK